MVDRHKTSHFLSIGDASDMSEIEDQTIDLVITSPPYPMIQMWDHLFTQDNLMIAKALAENDSAKAFELMHQQLDGVWDETFRVMKPGGLVCINIGDATRTIDGHFQLFPNHSRIITKFHSLGYSQLPSIIWRKPTNAPNKFMGSGMLPPGAYVTLEHEYLLIFRKGARRVFNKNDKAKRRQSAYFWEERNAWFSDIWFDLRGTSQNLKSHNRRSGSFPLDLPFRLINMFSICGDTILDPFLGSGTTMIAAMCTDRNCIGYEIDPALQPVLLEKIAHVPAIANQMIRDRIEAHIQFVRERTKAKGDLKYTNRYYGFPVMTRQEEDLRFHRIENIRFQSGSQYHIEYVDLEYPADLDKVLSGDALPQYAIAVTTTRGRQLKMF